MNEYHQKWYQNNKDAVNVCKRVVYQQKKRASINHQHDAFDNRKHGNMSSIMGRTFAWIVHLRGCWNFFIVPDFSNNSVLWEHFVYKESVPARENEGSSANNARNGVLEYGHNDANEQFVTSGLFGDSNMLTNMVGNFSHSGGNVAWGISYRNYIVNIISPMKFIST